MPGNFEWVGNKTQPQKQEHAERQDFFASHDRFQAKKDNEKSADQRAAVNIRQSFFLVVGRISAGTEPAQEVEKGKVQLCERNRFRRRFDAARKRAESRDQDNCRNRSREERTGDKAAERFPVGPVPVS